MKAKLYLRTGPDTWLFDSSHDRYWEAVIKGQDSGMNFSIETGMRIPSAETQLGPCPSDTYLRQPKIRTLTNRMLAED